jgi:hypothetical protein
MKFSHASCHSSAVAAARGGRGTGGVLLLAVLCLAGCGSQTSVPSSSSPSSYVGLSLNGSNLALDTFAIDHSADTFVQDSYVADVGYEEAVLTSGTFTTLSNGILNIGVTFGNGTLDADSSGGIIYNPPQTGNWALEWPGQGGFAGLLGQKVVPFAFNQTCPAFPSPETFQFVTFPVAGDSNGTAYGRAAIASAGGAISFTSDTQFTILGGTPGNPSPASASGTCGPTVFGQTISVPDTTTLSGAGQTPAATIAISPGGFLVEGNGYIAHTTGAIYQNIMGAGLGAIGLPQPASPLSSTAPFAAQYNAYFFTTGASTKTNSVIVPSASLIGSFGFANLQTACPTLPAPQTPTILYGGEFGGNNPSLNATSNCDFAIDLGTQDPNNNGLYPKATVYVGAKFPRASSNPGFPNQPNTAYSFSAVAVAGQLQGKYAIFLIGLDSVALQTVVAGATQDWGIYLLQSN